MDLTYSLASCMFLFLAVLCILNVLRRWNQNSGSNFPPGPRSLPLIGNLHMINLKRPHRSFIELSKQYGAIYSIQMGSVKIVVLSGYETVKSALVDYAEDFSERPHIPIFKDIFQGYGIPFSHGENWKEMRRFTLSTLRNFGMGKRTIEDKISLECNFLIKEFELQKGNPTDPTSTIHVAIGNIITSIVLGHRFDYQHPTLRRVLSLVNENIKLLGTASILIYNFFPILGFLPGNHKKVKQNIAELNSFLRKTFLEHHKELDRDDQRSFIDAFLVKQQEEKDDPKSYYHDTNLISVVITLFTAGTETTSSTISWAILFMIKYPAIQKRVQEEIEKVIGTSQPRSEHRKDMPYTNAVIHETQRVANIVPMNLPRETTKDIVFKGYDLPKVGEFAWVKHLQKWSYSCFSPASCKSSTSILLLV
ncbi:hypothetical protein FKM82_011334 [Ascaphus truei]|uniref:cytochrome P450 2K4-like isoform X2 n=1 Tax=Ascaphus truei TaxID=8439 RepID=UPI003F59DE4F